VVNNMENAELIKIEKEITNLEFNDQKAVQKIIGYIDDIYIILDENNHINLFNERLSALKSNLASTGAHEDEKENIFNTSRKELLRLLEDVSVDV